MCWPKTSTQQRRYGLLLDPDPRGVDVGGTALARLALPALSRGGGGVVAGPAGWCAAAARLAAPGAMPRVRRPCAGPVPLGVVEVDHVQVRRHLLDEVFRERGRVDHGAAHQSGGVDTAKHIRVAVAALLQFVQPPGQRAERAAVDDRLGQRRQPRAGPDLAHRGDGSGVPDVIGFGEVSGGGGGALRGQGGEGVTGSAPAEVGLQPVGRHVAPGGFLLADDLLVLRQGDPALGFLFLVYGMNATPAPRPGWRLQARQGVDDLPPSAPITPPLAPGGPTSASCCGSCELPARRHLCTARSISSALPCRGLRICSVAAWYGHGAELLSWCGDGGALSVMYGLASPLNGLELIPRPDARPFRAGS